MNLSILESEAFEEQKRDLKQSVLFEMKELLKHHVLSTQADWITLAEAQKLFSLMSKTFWQKFRIKEELPTLSSEEKILCYILSI